MLCCAVKPAAQSKEQVAVAARVVFAAVQQQVRARSTCCCLCTATDHSSCSSTYELVCPSARSTWRVEIPLLMTTMQSRRTPPLNAALLTSVSRKRVRATGTHTITQQVDARAVTVLQARLPVRVAAGFQRAHAKSRILSLPHCDDDCLLDETDANDCEGIDRRNRFARLEPNWSNNCLFVCLSASALVYK